MKVGIVVEGLSDKDIIKGLSGWFENIGLTVDIITAHDKTRMVKSSRKHFHACIWQGSRIVFFLVDQNADACVLETRNRFDVDSESAVVVSVVKSKLEAWILADGQCIRKCFGTTYTPAGMTDSIRNPKELLFTMFTRKYNYRPTERVVTKMVAPHFSLERASLNNTSARYFRDKALAVSKMVVF